MVLNSCECIYFVCVASYTYFVDFCWIYLNWKTTTLLCEELQSIFLGLILSFWNLFSRLSSDWKYYHSRTKYVHSSSTKSTRVVENLPQHRRKCYELPFLLLIFAIGFPQRKGLIIPYLNGSASTSSIHYQFQRFPATPLFWILNVKQRCSIEHSSVLSENLFL